MPLPAYHNAITRLKDIFSSREPDEFLMELLGARDEVLERYGQLFTADGINNLSEQTFRDFLMFRNNRHWTGLQRMGPSIVSDMKALKGALTDLVDESTPLADRLNSLIGRSNTSGGSRVNRLGKAVLTPILLIAHPDQYGVWNGTSEGAMRELGIWPIFERGMPIGERYEIVNDLLRNLATEVGVDLWTLDALWYRIATPIEELVDDDEEDMVEGSNAGVRFSLERHLHDFLLDNWGRTRLGVHWDLDEVGGDIHGYGYERATPIGRIDLLAHHKTEPRWLVIELKRGQTSDETLGQVQRYMGWVMEELATENESVEGLIIGLREDKQLRFALKATQGVRFNRYEIDFRLLEDH